MAEHSEHPTEDPGGPGDRTSPAGGSAPPPAAPGDRPEGAGERATAPEDRPVASAPYASGGTGADLIEGGHGGRGSSARPGRFRRWSANAPVRMGAVALVAGLVGGLVGGGIVAAFSGDGHDRKQPVRFERAVPGMRGGPGFGGPRYLVPRGRWARPDRPAQPTQSPLPTPPAQPTPKSTG